MKILKMDIQVDKLPDGCNIAEPGQERCTFNWDKYCALKIALEQGNTFVQNNRGVVPEDCPLRIKEETTRKDKVTIIDKDEHWVFEREEAKAFCLEAITNSEGSEKERYMDLYNQVCNGETLCD